MILMMRSFDSRFEPSYDERRRKTSELWGCDVTLLMGILIKSFAEIRTVISFVCALECEIESFLLRKMPIWKDTFWKPIYSKKVKMTSSDNQLFLPHHEILLVLCFHKAQKIFEFESECVGSLYKVHIKYGCFCLNSPPPSLYWERKKFKRVQYCACFFYRHLEMGWGSWLKRRA